MSVPGQYKHPMLDTFERCFNGEDGDYTFTMSHISLQGRDVECRIEKGQWVLTQRHDNGRVWTARSESKLGAVLLLIAIRGGLAGVFGECSYAFEGKPDDDPA